MGFDGDYSRFLKFFVVGILGVFVNQSVLWFLTEGFGVFYLISSALAIETAIVCNFILNYFWTFRDLGRGHFRRRFLKFNIVSYSLDFFNIVILYVLVERFSVYYLVANLLGMACVMVFKYILHLRWTWKV